MKVYLVIEDIAQDLDDIIHHTLYKHKLDAINHIRVFKESKEVQNYKINKYNDEIIEEDNLLSYSIYPQGYYIDSHHNCYIKELELNG